MARTAIGLFENRTMAKKVISDLESCGLPLGKIRVLGDHRGLQSPGSLSTGHVEFEVDSTRELERIGATRLEVEAYLNGLRRGGILVLATASDEKVDVAARIMSQGGAFDVKELMSRNRVSPAWYAKYDTFPQWA